MVKEFYNCDCMELMAKMPNKCVEFTLTDIPYEYSFISLIIPHSKAGGGETHNMSTHKIVNTQINRLTFDLDKFLDELIRITKGTIIIFCSVEQQSQIFTKFNQIDKASVRKMVFEKTNAFPNNANRNYLNNLEMLVCLKFPNATFNNTMQSSVLTFPMEDKSTRIHPTEKPHKLLEKLILDNSNRDDIVFDPCMGSGSTCLVALQNGRSTIGCEIDKEIYDKAIARLKDQGNTHVDLLEEFREEQIAKEKIEQLDLLKEE